MVDKLKRLMVNSDFNLEFIGVKSDGIEMYDSTFRMVEESEYENSRYFRYWKINPRSSCLICLSGLRIDPSILIVQELKDFEVVEYQEDEDLLWIMIE